MEKYKVCPTCGVHNPPTKLECIECETDLSGVRVIDAAIEKAEQESSNNECSVTISQNSKMIRICDCGAKNVAQARKCKECGEDISMNPIMQDCDEEEKYILTSIDEEYAYEINTENIIVGREHDMKAYLDKKPYVSRKHAEVLLKDGKLFIKNYSNTNFTFVNNVKISSEEFLELHDGDEIGLGGNSQDGERQQDAAYFIVRMS